MNIKLTGRRTKTVDADGTLISGSLNYLVSGAAGRSDEEVLDAVYSSAPEHLGGALRQSAELADVRGAGVYDVEVDYSKEDAKVLGDRADRRAGDEYWSFDAAGGEVHIESALSQVTKLGESALTDNVGLKIGWDGKFNGGSDCRGAEALLPSMRESCIATLSASSVTNSFKRRLALCVGKVNSVGFHGWEAGEVLFLGCSQSAEYRNAAHSRLVDVTYNFAIRENRTQVEVGDFKLDCNGWDHCWQISDYTATEHLVKVRAVFVSRIYRRINLKLLGIG